MHPSSVIPVHLIVEALEEEALHIELEANLENFSDDKRCIEHIPVLVPGVKSRQKNVQIVQTIEENLGNQPSWGENGADESTLILHPVTDLA